MEKEAPDAWYVVRTQVKREHIAAAHLRKLDDVEVFLPRIRYLKNTRRGKIWWVEALFPGYLLAKFDHYHLSRAVTHCPGVSKVVGFGQSVPEVPTSFVTALQEQVAKFQTEGDEIQVGWKLTVGEEVEIADGPFKGMEGTVLKIRSATERVSLLLDFLGEEKPIELSLAHLLLSGPNIPDELRNQ
ncbi:hypothetical protein N9868_02610 [Akkermansiaceae bacterium]|nr:hypothetical protein [Akkermansiaceae bacterium]MDB4288694.1 hypothetical protein [bacterium]MDA8960299.1 hypothetical protein [Akkermansiaceae bacterium]MDB4258491.1 hypothetical protein [Akkermansiaceae bacterium]MDB4268294.1 hypothetical protein [Akkermansiaceae bacterium]